MKAYRYQLEIKGGMPNSDFMKVMVIDEVAIPDLGICINKTGIFTYGGIEGRMSTASNRQEVELNKDQIKVLKKVRDFKSIEQDLINSLKLNNTLEVA